MTPEPPQPFAYRSTIDRQIPPPEASRIDLHLHSTASDGIRSPRDLVADVIATGVTLLALTDHDTLAGVMAVAEMDLPRSVQLLPGVEINAIADGVPGLWEGELHILGLGVDPGDEGFAEAMASQRARRARRFDRMVERLSTLGLDVGAALEADPPRTDEAVGRPHLARVLVAAGYASSVDDAMRRLLARDQPAWEPRTGLGPKEAIQAITAAGGLPVLAHFAEASERRDLVADLKVIGLRGLEVHYRRFGPETTASVGAVARDLGLVATGGSDYHGDGETYAEAHATLAVPDTVGSALAAALAGAGDGGTRSSGRAATTETRGRA